MTRILFVQAGDSYQKYRERFCPLWPAYLASYLEKSIPAEEFEFCFINGENIEDYINSFNPHLVAISSVSSKYGFAVNYARVAKSFGLPVVIGGIHISFMPHTLTKDMDVGCIGEGVKTFSEIVRHYLDCGEFKPDKLGSIKGIVSHSQGKISISPSRPPCTTLDDIPHPKRSVIGYQRSSTMVTSLGCKHRCVFCSASRYWKKVLSASPEYVMEEIEELRNNGAKIISIYDELFTADKERLKLISEKIIENGYNKNIRFTCWARSTTITHEVVKILKSMNIVAVYMGLESGCDRTLKYLKGNVTVKDNLQAINLLKDAGIQTNGSMIIGAPDETRDEIMQTYDFIKENRLDTITVYPLVPFPGTPVWEFAKKKDLVSDDMDWEKIYSVSLSEILSDNELSSLLKKFRKLCYRKRLKALPRSPFLIDFPRIVTQKFIHKAISMLSH